MGETRGIEPAHMMEDSGCRSAYEEFQAPRSVGSGGASRTREAARMLREHLGDEVRLRERRSGTESVVAWSSVQQAERVRKQSEAMCDADDLDACRSALLRADSILAVAEDADEGWVEPLVLRGKVAYRLAGLAENRDAAMQWMTTAVNHADRAIDWRCPSTSGFRGP